ncbi:F box domain [Trypanosoma vivax]|uniref:F-box domain-containing protein n=1 Tax=Trypanosoma vivax (strain Y486) TaxID=1055687 RepID=G0U894_TRYVY|nr:hypothetical protein TRVL_05193 [Trypanosoma vivax]KAH8607326.1 F box domain [Trypanosoma vivax]CCC52104.1 conserved hypothetical protein [Trypanosoma vivax Y486]
MSWAERLRATLKPAESQDRCKSKKDDDQKHSCSPCEFNEVVNKSRGYCSRNTSFHFGRLPPDMWVLIFSFLNFREVQNVSCTCSLLWKIAHSRDSIWAVQLEYFRRDILSLRGDGRLLCTELVTSSFTSAYDKLKVERMLYDIDTRREWHFKDREGTDSSQVIFSCPLVLDDDNHEGSDAVNYGWGNEPFVPLDRVRIFRAVPLTLSRTDAFLYAGGGDHLNLIYEPSEYVMLCDCINRGDFTASRVGVLDCTEEEDQLFLLALRSTFHHAKQRSPPRSSRGEPRPFQHLFLRHFSGKLLSICRYEAEQILESLLRLPNVLDNFVVRSDQWRAPCFSGANSTPQMQTHYFIAPELCRHERIGLIIVDSVRMLVVLGRERVHQFDAQWGGEYEVSGGRGHSTPGEGMNPQPTRQP